jgi:hypothetical protein
VQQQMKTFITRIIIFSIPLLILYVIPASVLYSSGENYKSIDHVILSNENYLIGYAYNEPNYKYLKHKELENRNNVEVIALGSSRVLQLRDKMFSRSFYNAGYTISSISDFLPFVDSNMKNKKPKILLIALDQWMFNVNWDDLTNYDPKNKNWHASFDKNASNTTLINVWTDLLKGKYGLEIAFSNPQSSKSKIGLNAIVNDKGFRKDGSMNYGDHIQKLLAKDSSSNDFDYLDTYSRIENGNMRFQYGNNVNDISLQVLKDLLYYCKKNDIYVVGFLPPFADKVNLKIKHSGNYSYMDSIFNKTNKIFKLYNFELWDMTNLKNYHSNDNETIDGFHSSEVTDIKMLIHMVENGSKLKDFTNLQELKSSLSNKKNDYLVYEN